MQAAAFQPNPCKRSKPDSAGYQRLKDEHGIAMVLVLIALSLMTAFSAYMVVTSVEDLRSSDNSESMLQARFAARAGIDHAREILRGLKFNDVLRGPDGTWDSSTGYMATARSVGFRNITSWAALRSLDVLNPASDVSSLPDDGLINTGLVGGTPGTVLAPKTGIAFTATNPYGGGTLTTARYFLKVTDNNGEAAELAKDATDNPFIDGDGTIIVRAVGTAKTLNEGAGSSVRKNSVSVFESRFAQGGPFSNMGSPALVIGSQIGANFSGNAFSIIGTSDGPGIGTIDTNLSDSYHPDQILRAATSGKGTITGNCVPNVNCITDITASVMADPNKAHLRDPAWLYDFVFNQIPSYADNKILNGSIAGVNLGTTSNPKITWVDGNLNVTGGITGAGLLVVTGELDMGGAVNWDGLVLVIGTGDFWAHGMNRGIHGGLVVANLTLVGGVPTFGLSTIFDIRGNSDIASYDGSLASMGNGLFPLKQISFREITSRTDP
jgi:hypothetical protein